MSARRGENDVTHFRSERILSMNGKWYFAVREKTNLVGPFSSKEAAQKSASAYIEDIASGHSEVDAMSHQFVRRAFSLK